MSPRHRATFARARAAAAAERSTPAPVVGGQVRKRRDQREEREQIWLFQWARAKEGMHPELRWLFHVPNGGGRSKAEAGRLKAAGVKPGVPDLLLPVRRGPYVGCAIELKAEGGRTSDDQRKWIAHLQTEGWQAGVAVGWREAATRLLRYLDAPQREIDELLTKDFDPEDRGHS